VALQPGLEVPWASLRCVLTLSRVFYLKRFASEVDGVCLVQNFVADFSVGQPVVDVVQWGLGARGVLSLYMSPDIVFL